MNKISKHMLSFKRLVNLGAATYLPNRASDAHSKSTEAQEEKGRAAGRGVEGLLGINIKFKE